jgi:hypothetical protein
LLTCLLMPGIMHILSPEILLLIKGKNCHISFTVLVWLANAKKRAKKSKFCMMKKCIFAGFTWSHVISERCCILTVRSSHFLCCSRWRCKTVGSRYRLSGTGWFFFFFNLILLKIFQGNYRNYQSISLNRFAYCNSRGLYEIIPHF